MSLTPIPGVTRLRKFQLGVESTFKTQVPCTRRMPWTWVPDVNPNLTFTTADTGTLPMAIAPYPTAQDLVGPATGELFANDVPTLFSAAIMGGISPTGAGTAKTWAYTPAALTQDVFDTWTGEWYDDATGDAWAFTGGVINDFTLTYPDNQGPIALSANWRFAKIGGYDTSAAGDPGPATPTAGLFVDLVPTPLFAADTQLYINDTAGTIETTALSDVLYNSTISYNNNLDVKRFQNGSNTRFQVQNYGRGERVIQFTGTGAKQASWIAEAVKWIAASPSERFFGIKTTSKALAEAGIPYSLDIRIPGYWITRTNTEVNTNTAFQMMAHQVYDPTLQYDFAASVVCTRATL